MKRFSFHRFLPALAALSGVAGYCLRSELYTLADPSGLLPHGHIFHRSAVALSILVAILVSLGTLKEKDTLSSAPRSLGDGLLAILAGCCLIPEAYYIYKVAANPINFLSCVLAFAAIPCLMYVGYCRIRGFHPLVFGNSLVCLFFAFYMVSKTQLWSAQPQIEQYLFPMFACITLSLGGYYRAALDANMCKRKPLLFFSLLALHFCISALPGNDEPWFYVAGALWALSTIPTIYPPKYTEDSTHVSA